MIAVDFAENSRSQLVMSVRDPFGDRRDGDVSAAPDLLFAALRGMMPAPVVAAVAVPVAAEPAPAPSYMPIAVLRRMRNPLYSMFGAVPA